MQFSKFAVLLASSSALAAPLDLEAGTGNAVVPRQIGAGLNAIINLTSPIAGLTSTISNLINGLGLPATINQLLAILGQVGNGLTAAQIETLALAQSRLLALGDRITTAQSDLLNRITGVLALAATVPGTIQGTTASTLQTVIGRLSATAQQALTTATGLISGPVSLNAVGNLVVGGVN
ncbi:hypothetical protein MCOR16_006361 [Pyricularia oryzae]|nr:hypothetical protein MCOR15_001278 [Pyricularia oryzae]KAI6525727.1 hypothetical protein MCOR16_006361 [Pyricularia oryzae]